MRAEFGPGKYFLGELCYVLKDDIYKDVWGKKHNYEEGQFDLEDDNGHSESFAVAQTAYGDGEYHDQQGREYCVDAGVIGIIPSSMWKVSATDIASKGLGTVLTIKKELTMNAENGIFTVTADDEEIVIDTNQPELDDEDWDDEDGDEDFEEDEDLDEDEDEDDGNGFEKGW